MQLAMSSGPKTLLPFLLLSLSLHLLLLFGWPKAPRIEAPSVQIPVSFLPPIPAPLPERPALKRVDTPKPLPPPPPRTVKPAPEPIPRKVIAPEKTAAREELASRKSERPLKDVRNTDLASRPLPSLKQLLPPVTWSSSRAGAEEDGPVRLDTREPRYMSYFETIKRAIERVWEYPDSALRSGLEGKLIVEFTVLQDGALVGPRLVRSSGFLELDDEAMRAVRSAAPFRPIPTSVGRNRIDIVASFEYYDNRLHYHFTR